MKSRKEPTVVHWVSVNKRHHSQFLFGGRSEKTDKPSDNEATHSDTLTTEGRWRSEMRATGPDHTPGRGNRACARRSGALVRTLGC